MRVRGPTLSVLMCTYNPRPEFVSRALRALGVQDLPPDAYELVIVDNNSSPPLDHSRLARLAGRGVRVVREARQGLTYARSAAIRAAGGDLLCFVDDDNELCPTYLSSALEIAADHPELGVFGGVAEGAPDANPGLLWRTCAPFLGVRDLGPEPKFADGSSWQEAEPIGAGICVRRSVADVYADFVDSVEGAGGLGRKGSALLSGEDSLFSRIAHQLGLRCGYMPQMRLRHHVPRSRLTIGYLFKLMEGHGRSFVILEAIAGRSVTRVPEREQQRVLMRNFLHRLRTQGLVHAALHAPWDLGFARQSRSAPTGVSLPEFVARRRAFARAEDSLA